MSQRCQPTKIAILQCILSLYCVANAQPSIATAGPEGAIAKRITPHVMTSGSRSHRRRRRLRPTRSRRPAKNLPSSAATRHVTPTIIRVSGPRRGLPASARTFCSRRCTISNPGPAWVRRRLHGGCRLLAQRRRHAGAGALHGHATLTWEGLRRARLPPAPRDKDGDLASLKIGSEHPCPIVASGVAAKPTP